MIGDPVNLAAKLEKHTKEERVRALCTAEAYRLALDQHYLPRRAPEPLAARRVAGVEGALDLVVVA